MLDSYWFSLVYLRMTKGENMKNLIRLESVGTALNMKTGMTHPINADGTIDFDEGMAEHILYDTGGFDEDGFELYNFSRLRRASITTGNFSIALTPSNVSPDHRAPGGRARPGTLTCQ